MASMMMAALVIAGIAMSYVTIPPAGKTGAPGESTCTACHNTPSTGYAGDLILEGLPSEILAGTTYTLTVRTITTGDSTPVKGGFELVALDTSQNNAGSITILLPDETSLTELDSKSYIGHNNAKGFVSDTLSWVFNWTAPTDAGEVTFYAASVLADGSNQTSGDNVLTLQQSAIVVLPPTMTTSIENVQEPICNGLSNGIAQAVVANGMQPYTYLWSNGDTTSWTYHVAAGTLSVTVTDANGLADDASVNVSEPTPVVATLVPSATSMGCGDTITLSATASGGTGSYTFNWTTGENDVDVIQVTQGGTYCVSAYDENQCAVTECVGINQGSSSVICSGISGADTLTCNNPSTTLVAMASSSTPVTYTWTGPDNFTSTDSTVTIDVAGQYQVTASVDGGCTCTSMVQVVEEKELTVQITELIPTTCSYTEDGSIDVEVVAGDFEPFTIDPIIDGESLAAGDYSITVTNGFGCSTVLDFTIESPDSIGVTLESITDIQAGMTGSIDITTTGGTPGYNWNWTMGSTPVGTTEDLTELTEPGDYMLQVVDSNDCSFSFGPYMVDLIESIQDVAFANSLSISPNPADDYIIIKQDEQIMPLDIKIYGINNQFIGTYTFSNQSNRIDVTNLPAGTYSIIIQSNDRLAVKQFVKK